MKSSSPLKYDLMSSVLDGEAGSDECREYQERLDSDPEAQRLHQFHARLKQMVKESGQVGQVSSEARARLMKALSEARPSVAPTPLKPVEQKPRRSWVTAAAPWMGAAASICAILGVSVIHTAANPNSNALALALARDHSHYLGEVGAESAGNGNSVNPTLVAMHQFGQAPEMAEFPGLRQYDARVCNCSVENGGGQPILHVVYRVPGDGRVVSMYGVPEERAMGIPLNETIDRIQPTMTEADREALATWKRRGWVFSLVSNMPPDQLQQLAQRGVYGGYGSASSMMNGPAYGPSGNFNQGSTFVPQFNQVEAVGRTSAQPAVYQTQSR